MSDKTAISVQNVSKSFKLPHEKHSGLKSAILHFRPGKKYELQHVLKDISFDIKEGEFFGIVGRNGSGKSTLLKLLAQIYTPNKGAVSVKGSLTPFIELGVGFNPELTGRENVYLNGALLGFDRKQVAEMYDDIVEFAEIEKFMDQKLKNYSSGMQVRLAFSIAIRAKSDILLIDEVLAVGDAAFQQKCFSYFEKLKKGKTTVVLVTHDMSAVRRFCTRALLIDRGRITEEGSPSEVASAYTVENLESTQVGSKSGNTKPTTHKITFETTTQPDGKVLMQIAYQSQDDAPMYVGISVMRDGISVAEISTGLDNPLIGNGALSYSLDSHLFNNGVYETAAALFRLENRELISASRKTGKFVVGGFDITKGAALKLPDTWNYGEARGKS
jgi:ABC-2 type transport system ATP-binding protein